MKNRAAWIVLTIALLLLAVPFALAEDKAADKAIFVMPEHLIEIGPEAFLNTGARGVVLTEQVERVGERAFARMEDLSAIYIPASTTYIAEDAFQGVDGLTILGRFDSYAHRWAREHGYRFISVELWINDSDAGRRAPRRTDPAVLDASLRGTDDELPEAARGPDEGTSLRPQERAELHPIDYRFP